MNRSARTLLVGIGSPHGDDRAGWVVADALAGNVARNDELPANPSVARVRKVSTPVDLLDWLDGIQRLIVCDAVSGVGAPGTLHRWQWPDARLSQVRSAGSHDFGVAAALELAARIGRLPADVVVWGVEGAMVRPIDRLSPAVEKALPELIRQVQGELGF